MSKVENYINRLSERELRQYIDEFVSTDPKLSERFCAFIADKLCESSAEEEIGAVVRAFAPTKLRGKNEVKNWDKISTESNRLFKRAKTAILHGRPDIAIVVGLTWLECFRDNYDEEALYHDDDGQLNLDCEAAADLIELAVSAACTTQEWKEVALKEVNKLAEEESIYTYYDYVDLEALLHRLEILMEDEDDEQYEE